ncbi:MAG: DUF1343 domain-containing protein [Thiotrichaceae bacterium]|nr:DUF1343 domain-containing protein [Thiotrichaceae bacterium]
MKLGIDVLLADASMRESLQGKRVALLATPASVTSDFKASIDALAECKDINLTACFGPQHGLRGDQQDNMEETHNTRDAKYAIPVYSLYGEVRRPTAEMLASFDVLLVDIQDVGCRIYTFITTLFYLLEDFSDSDKQLWVLDRPNPAGREIEGLSLIAGQESFVGAAPIPMRHGLTLGESAQWYKDFKQLNTALTVIAMQDYEMKTAPDFGWPQQDLSWINPSPNIATLNAVRIYSGTVLLEGTTLSEGRGTTRPLELFGAPDLDTPKILQIMAELAPEWMAGCRIREIWFKPTFHKYQGELCAGVQLHTDFSGYKAEEFKPFRFMVLFLKAVRLCYPDDTLWRDFDYEYEFDRLAIDVINGGSYLREWVDDPQAQVSEMEERLLLDEMQWKKAVSGFLLY